MADRMRRALLLIWRMVYPLLIYQVLSGLLTAGVEQVAARRAAEGFFPGSTPAGGIADGMILPLTAAGALIAAVPLGHMYWQFRTERCSFGGQSGENDSRRRDLPARKRILLWSGLAGICASLCFNNLLGMLPAFAERTRQVTNLIYSPSFGMQFLCTVVLVPFTEELVFRGLGYRRIRTELPFVWAALISAVFFGLYHGNLYQGVYACFLGILLAFLFEQSDSLLAVWEFHAAANLASITMNAMAWDKGIFEYIAVKVAIFTATGLLLAFLLSKIREDGRKREITIDSDSLL